MKRKDIRWQFIGLCLMLGLGSNYAQSNQVRAFTLSDGLPQSQVYDLVQDRLGYLWLGTQGGGICRFDGEHFQVWNERDGLLSNYIHSLEVSEEGLYIGTRRGLSVMTRQSFVNYPCPQVHAIRFQDSLTYLATQSGLYTFTEAGGPEKWELHDGLDRAVIRDVLFDRNKGWIASSNGLWLWENQATRRVHNGDFRSLTRLPDKVLAASYNQGIFACDTLGKSISQFQFISRINHLAVFNENQLWVSTDDAGAWVINARNFEPIQKIDKASGLSVLHIRKCLQDRQANIWMASSGGGLYKYAFSNFRHFDREAGMKGNRIYAVHAMGEKIVASNSESGLVEIDSLQVRPLLENDPRFKVKIKTIAHDESGNIWVGTEGQGIRVIGTQVRDSLLLNALGLTFRLDTVHMEETLVRTLSTQDGLNSDWIRKIYPVGSDIWVASYSSGIMRFTYNFEQDSLTSLRSFGKSEGMENMLVNDMQMDSLGRMWYGTRKGYLGYITDKRVRHLGNVLGDNSDITCLRFSREYLFVGTAGKGIWWTELNDSLSFQMLEGNKELYSQNIFQLVFDNQYNLWVGSERGVDRIELNSSNQIVELYHFDQNDGFLGIETCLNATAKDSSGNLWFGTINGLTQYQPAEQTFQQTQPTLEFEEVEVVYQALDSVDINEWAHSGRVLWLSPKQNHLAFRYRTIDLNHPGAVAYRWRLNGADWSPWSDQNAIQLAGLSHGDYLFEAQSRNLDWTESEILPFRFHITQPLYQKTWFRRLMLGILIGFILLVFFLYLRRVQIKNKKDKERLELENHLLSLEQKALRLQMNPHFVFNVLNGIKASGASDPEKMNHTINQFASLMRGILNNSRQDYISLGQEMRTLQNYIEVEQLMAPQEFTYELSFDSDLDPEEVLIPPMLVQPFVENAIRHGIMAVKRPGKLEVRFWVMDNFLHCAVKDNGMGIYQAQQAKKSVHHQSLALEVTRQRIESLSGSNSLDIREISSADSAPGGTHVEFRIPLHTDY